jgi:hypothetical protein
MRIAGDVGNLYKKAWWNLPNTRKIGGIPDSVIAIKMEM